MSEQWEEQVDEFEAVADNGEHYRIQEWVGMIDVTEAGFRGQSGLGGRDRSGIARLPAWPATASMTRRSRSWRSVLNVGRVAASS